MSLHDFLRIVEIRTKVVSLSTLSLGILYVWVVQGSLPLLPLLIFVPAALMVDMGTTAFNSFFDYLSGVDAKEHNREADKVLVHRGVAPGLALLVGLALFGLAAALGLVLVWLRGLWILPLGAGLMAVGFLYNAGPLPLSRTPLGEAFAGGALGGGLFLLTLAVLGVVPDAQAWWYALPSTLFIGAILAVNNACDRLGDTASGRHTMAILLGPRGSVAWTLALVWGAMAAGMGVSWLLLPPHPSWLLALPWAAAAILVSRDQGAMLRRGFDHPTKGPNMGAISRMFLMFTLAMAASLVLRAVLEMGRA